MGPIDDGGTMAKRAGQHRITRREAVTTAADIVGGALVSAGAWLIYAPAGFIVAGILIIAASVMSA